MKKKLFLFALSLVASSAFAAVQNGEEAPDFTLMDTDGEEVSLSDFDGQYVVLEWLNHGCPFVKAHYNSGNMQSLQEEYTDQDVVWLSIVSSAPGKQGHDTAEGHQKTAKEKGSNATAILMDESGEVGQMYGAKTTPHMFIIDPEGVLIYQGGIDDSPRGDPAEANNYVSAALDASMAGEKVEQASTRPYGCSVKY
ncbi:thioredoxin family protein [Puniceicoccus vermicola]|uniref:Thioredoxin family protein n=1 Tax=Puniceicoccus vermicola TaxID=388746 RepID=A0A7X1AYR8_9BACT|nr:thioredoxin family protein [Puniceicoccus vermicola]MBC2601305.1 thioredoxin family protein [Puniceicoccus vermicola]